MNTVKLAGLLAEVYAALPAARHEADWLASHYLGIKKSELPLHHGDDVPAKVADELKQAAARRLAGVPLQYITGLQPFWDFELIVSPDVLIPRWDSEPVVEQALSLLNKATPCRVADVCCGSGAYALTIKHERPLADVAACDISPAALDIARRNAAKYRLNIAFYQGDLLAALPAGSEFDLIVSNPPYICDGADLPQDVLQEPHLALFGGADGLDFYRRLAKKTPRYLKNGGHLLLEIGCEQADDVTSLLQNAGFVNICRGKDLAGLNRWVQAQKA